MGQQEQNIIRRPAWGSKPKPFDGIIRAICHPLFSGQTLQSLTLAGQTNCQRALLL